MKNDYKKQFTDFFEQNLNPEQQRAVSHERGALLVIAGAGSGKTRVITTRIAYLIVHNVSVSDGIVALTFTNKAAGEMRERIGKFLPPGVSSPFIGTFHSYCLNTLKKYAHLTNRPQFTILDGEDQLTLITNILKKHGLEKKVAAKQVIYQIGMLNNARASNTMQESYIDPLIVQIADQYEQEKKFSNCYDFDDLLLEVLELFKTDRSFKEMFQQRVRHILVDEYQDTNSTQHELLKQMALTHDGELAIDSLCAVGDEDQSIYSWRGATVANILHFKKDFPNTTVITIEQNYRSASPILSTANQVIRNNTQRNPKNLWSDKEGSDRVRIIRCLSNYQEGEAFANAIKSFYKKDPTRSCAVLYRAHYQSRAIEEALIRHSVAYRIIGGIAFYERKEIKDLLAYIRLMVNPFDRVSFFRIINYPLRGLGDKFQELVQEQWQAQPFFTFIDVLNHLVAQQLIPASKRSTLQEFIALFASLTADTKPQAALQQLLEKTAFISHLKHAYDSQEAEAKVENVKELLRATLFFEQQGIVTLTDFLGEVALVQDKKAQDDEQEHHVPLMTLHAAKGLEFDFVMLAGLEEGLFPTTRSLYDPDGLEEERRLFYVGITRARDYVLISHARYRYTFGSMTDQTASRFLDEVPESLAQRFDACNWQEGQIKELFNLWFNIQATSTMRIFSTAAKKVETPLTTNTHKQRPSTLSVRQSVHHAKFGVGIVKHIEERTDDDPFVTVMFKTGVKKIKSTFLKPS